ncbi:thioredoxin [bacterium]|nr:thioredoxin [candidate division CSSED10-310 bacterium]
MSEHVKAVGVDDFQEKVIAGNGLIVVDFWAPWCGPCRMVTPILEDIAVALAGQVTIFKLNVDENSDVARQYSVSGIPTLILFKNGKPVARHVGAAPKQAFEKLIRDNVVE